MKIIRTFLIPLLLCGAILAVGLFSPYLFNTVSPDYRDEAQSVSIAGAESPLYIENEVDVSLPPWDVIGDAAGTLLMDTLTEGENVTAEGVNLMNTYIANLVEAFGPRPADGEDFCSKMRVADQQLLFLRDYRYTPPGSGQYTLDLVLTSSAFPLYAHVRTADASPSPVSDTEAFEKDFILVRELFLPPLMDELGYEATDDSAQTVYIKDTLSAVTDQASEMYPDSYVPALTDALGSMTLFFSDPLAGTTESSSILYEWQNILLGTQDFYTMTYENETVIVLTDYNNRPYTLFFDGTENKCTGFGFDAEEFGYTSSPTPRPIERSGESSEA